jgi:hypothetical protein
MVWVLRQTWLSLVPFGLNICVPISASLMDLIYQILQIIVPSDCIKFIWRSGAIRILPTTNQSITPPRDLIEESRTSLPVTSGLWPSRQRIMDIGENPNMIPEDLLKLQMRGIMGTVPNPWHLRLILTKSLRILMRLSVRCCLLHLHQPNEMKCPDISKIQLTRHRFLRIVSNVERHSWNQLNNTDR